MKQDGYGRIIYPMGMSYIGGFKEDQRSDFGTSYKKTGEQDQRGHWENDLFVRHAEAGLI